MDSIPVGFVIAILIPVLMGSDTRSTGWAAALGAVLAIGVWQAAEVIILASR